MILEDDVGIVEIATFAFHHFGIQTFTSGNISGAFEILKHNKIDAIVSDVHLDSESGLDFYRSLLTTKHKDIPFAFMTGESVYWNEISGADRNPPKFFYKPCSFVAVAEYVAKTLQENKSKV